MPSIPDGAVIALDHIKGAIRTINASAVSEMAHVLQFLVRVSIVETFLLAVFGI